MSQHMPAAHIWVQSAYQHNDKPKRVELWEQQIAAAGSHDQAQTQIAYAQLVETHRLRVSVTAILVIMCIGFAVGLLVGLMALVA